MLRSVHRCRGTLGMALLSLVAAVAVQAAPIDFEGQTFLAEVGNTFADQDVVFKNFEDADLMLPLRIWADVTGTELSDDFVTTSFNFNVSIEF